MNVIQKLNQEVSKLKHHRQLILVILLNESLTIVGSWCVKYKINEDDTGVDLVANTLPFFAVRDSRPCQKVQLYRPFGGKVV